MCVENNGSTNEVNVREARYRQPGVVSTGSSCLMIAPRSLRRVRLSFFGLDHAVKRGSEARVIETLSV